MLKNIRIGMIALMLVMLLVVALLIAMRQWPKATQTANGTEPFRLGGPFNLIDHRGEPISEQAMVGQSHAVFFGFTSCPEVCPTTLFDVDRWMDAADPSGEQLAGYFVTVDPERDQPEIINSYVSHFSDRITGITGAPEDVWALAKLWNVFHEKRPYSDNPEEGYDINHTASVFLIDAKGNFRGTISWGEEDSLAVDKMKNLL